MKLSDWLAKENMNQTDFAELIGVRQASVARMAAGLQIPRKELMRVVIAVTGGEVGPLDFYSDGDGDVDPSSGPLEPEAA